MAVLLKLRPDAVAWLEIDGEIVALDHRTSTYLSVNRTGAVLWPALETGATHGELVDLLVQHFGVGAEAAAVDVDGFVAALANRGLLLPPT